MKNCTTGMKINPLNTKHQFGRMSFNKCHKDFGERPLADSHIQRALNMPKSYLQTLKKEFKKPHAHIYEQNNRFPDKIQLKIP